MKKTCLLLASLWIFLSCTPIHQSSLSAAPAQGEGLTQGILFHILAGEMAGLQGDLVEAAKHYLKAASLAQDPEVAKRAAQIALFAGDKGKALEAARRWAFLAPQDPQAHQLLALLELEQGHLDAALQEAETYLSLSPSPAERYMSIAALLAKSQHKEEALKVMDRIVKRHPSPEAHLAYATLALESGSFEKALKAVDEALSMRPGMPQGIILKAQILSLKDKKKAVDFLKDAVKSHPHERKLRLAYARLLIDVQAWEEALHQFERLLEEKPEDQESLYAMGLIALQLERLDRAEKAFLRLFELGKMPSTASYFLGHIAEARKQLDQALRWYRRVKEGEYHWDAQLRIAVVLGKLGQLEEARKRLHALPSPEPQQAIQKALAEGEMLREAGRLKEAMAVYNRALERFPEDLDLLYARALLAERMGDAAQSEKDLRRILELDPDNAQALNALGYMLTEHSDRYQEALQYIEKALKLRPEDAYILDSMGWVLYKMGDYPKALEYLRKALSQKADGEVAAHLVEVLWKMGRREEAKEVWEKAWKRHPDHPELKEVKARFFP